MFRGRALIYLSVPLAWAAISVGVPQQTIAPFKTNQANRIYYAGQSPYTSIQKAVTTACAGGSGQGVVSIEPGVTVSDNPPDVTGCNGVAIMDSRVRPSLTYGWNGTLYVPSEAELPSMAAPPYNAVGDNSTDNTAAFSSAESGLTTDFFIPQGIYKTMLSALSKRYWGPGSVILGGQHGIGYAGDRHSGMIGYDNDLTGINTLALGSPNPITVTIIGDSISVGYGIPDLDINKSYAHILQSMLNTRLVASGQGGMGNGNGGSFTGERITTSGSVTHGSAGPIHSSWILSSGSSISFPVTDVELFYFFFQRQAGGGTVTVTNGTGTYGTQSTTGSTVNDQLSSVFQAPSGTSSSQTISMACSGGPCEITGAYGYMHTLTAPTNPIIIGLQAAGGYATSDFAQPAVLASISAQTFYRDPSNFWIYYLALGTNDIYNPSKAVTSAQYKANLETIINGLAAAGGRAILTVPLRASETTYTPVLEPFDNYRNALYQVAREHSFPVVDLSELDLVSIGAYSPDGLHPNAYGHQIMADYINRKLHMASLAIQQPIISNPTTAPSGACTVNGQWVFSQDGHSTFCNAGTWTTKI